jgi:hypothetical protein
MKYYDNLQPDVIHSLKELNDKLMEEEKKDVVDKYKILKLKQQILMKGLEMPIAFNKYL